MADETCACGGSDVQLSERGSATEDRWIDERPVTDGALPEDAARLMTRFYSADAVETLGDFVSATREDAGGGAISVEQLCHVDGDSPHVASTPTETYQFRCFYDGVVLSFLAGEPVEIGTKSPAGKVVEVRTTPDGDVEAPPGSVVSFGIAADVEPTGRDGPDPADVYAAVCPYVKAFRTREAYEAWAAAVDAATVGLPLEAGMSIARGLTEGT